MLKYTPIGKISRSTTQYPKIKLLVNSIGGDMAANQKHHTNKGGGVILHFPNTCNLYDMRKSDVLYVDTHDKNPHQTSFGLPTEVRIVSSTKGLVVVLYFDQAEKSRILFATQISPKRGAWQNIAWEPNFHRNWDEKRVKMAVINFLEVAEQEDAK